MSKVPEQQVRPSGRGGRRSHRSALVVINRKAGTVRTRGAEQVRALVEEKLAPHFTPLRVVLVDGDVLPEVRKARDGGSHDVIIAGGGDGTITSVAAELLGSDRIMAALPLGTMNLFVQALGFSPLLEEALAQLATAGVSKVDVGVVNTRVFLHQVSFGLQPRMARLRERIGYSSRLTKMLATWRAAFTLAARPRPVRVFLDADGDLRPVKTPLLIISNNPLGRSGKPLLPQSLDQGKMGLYAIDGLSPARLVRLGLAYLANTVQQHPSVDARTAEAVTVSKIRERRWWRKRGTGLLASIDGEVAILETPVTLSVRPKGLRVLVPAAEATGGPEEK